MKKTITLNLMLVLTLMAIMPVLSQASVDSDLLRAIQEGNAREVRVLLEKVR